MQEAITKVERDMIKMNVLSLNTKVAKQKAKIRRALLDRQPTSYMKKQLRELEAKQKEELLKAKIYNIDLL